MSAPTVQIQVRLGSTRLPGKVLYTLGKCRIVEWVVRRCTRAKTPAAVVLAVGDEPENEAITEWCDRNDVRYVVGPEEDLLHRHAMTASEVGSDPVVRVTGDCPFVPPGEIDRLVREHGSNEARYTTNVTDDMPIGTAVDVIDRDVLAELRDLGESHPVLRLRENPGNWNTAVSENDRWSRYASTHIAVDTPTDYWTLTDALDTVGAEPFDVVQWVSQQ